MVHLTQNIVDQLCSVENITELSSLLLHADKVQKKSKNRPQDWTFARIASKDHLIGAVTTRTVNGIVQVANCSITEHLWEDNNFFGPREILFFLVSEAFANEGTGQINWVGNHNDFFPIWNYLKTLGEDLFDLIYEEECDQIILTRRDCKIILVNLIEFLPEVRNIILKLDMEEKVSVHEVCIAVTTGIYSRLEIEIILQSGLIPEHLLKGGLDFTSFHSLACLYPAIMANMTQKWIQYASRATLIDEAGTLRSYDEPNYPVVTWFDQSLRVTVAHHDEPNIWESFWKAEDLVLLACCPTPSEYHIDDAITRLQRAKRELGLEIQADRKANGSVHLILLTPYNATVSTTAKEIRVIEMPNTIDHLSIAAETLGKTQCSASVTSAVKQSISGKVVLEVYPIPLDPEFEEDWNFFKKRFDQAQKEQGTRKDNLLKECVRWAERFKTLTREGQKPTMSEGLSWEDLSFLDNTSKTIPFGVALLSEVRGKISTQLRLSGRASKLIQFLKSQEGIIVLLPISSEAEVSQKRWFWQPKATPLDEYPQVSLEEYASTLPTGAYIHPSLTGKDLLQRLLTTAAVSKEPVPLTNHHKHAVITHCLREFLYSSEAAPISFRFPHGNGCSGVFPVRVLGTQQGEDDHESFSIYKLGLITMRHPELDGIVDRYLLHNHIVSNSHNSSAEVEEHSFHKMIAFLDTVESNTLIELYHTGLEPAVIGVYRAVITELNAGRKFAIKSIFSSKNPHRNCLQKIWN